MRRRTKENPPRPCSTPKPIRQRFGRIEGLKIAIWATQPQQGRALDARCCAAGAQVRGGPRDEPDDVARLGREAIAGPTCDDVRIQRAARRRFTYRRYLERYGLRRSARARAATPRGAPRTRNAGSRSQRDREILNVADYFRRRGVAVRWPASNCWSRPQPSARRAGPGDRRRRCGRNSCRPSGAAIRRSAGPRGRLRNP